MLGRPAAHLLLLIGLPIGTGPLGFGCETVGWRPRSPVPGGVGRGVALPGLPFLLFALLLIRKRVVLDRDDVLGVDPHANVAGCWAGAGYGGGNPVLGRGELC